MATSSGLKPTAPIPRRVRVLYLLDGYTDPHAGTEKQFWLLFRNLDRSRFEPSILLLSPSGFLSAHVTDAPLGTLDVTRLRSVRSLWRIVRAAVAARRAGIDVAHLFFNDVCLVFPLLLRILGVRVIVSRRDLGFWYTKGNLLLLRFNARFVTRVIANSGAVARVVARAEGYPSSKVQVIYNGLAREISANALDVRTQLGLAAHARLIVMVANLRPLKRVDDAIRALSLIRRTVPEAHLIVIGEDRPGARGVSLRAELEDLAEQLGAASAVRFTGKLEDPTPFIAAADVCTLCSETEGLSNVVMEYMFAAKPVVCTAVGGNAELVTEGATGHLVPVGEPQQLAAAIGGLLANAEKAQRFGAAGRQRMLDLFQPRAMVEQHEALYAQLAGRAHDGGSQVAVNGGALNSSR